MCRLHLRKTEEENEVVKKWLKLFKPKDEDDGIDKKKVNPIIVWGIIIAVALLAGSSFFGGGDRAERKAVQENVQNLENIQTAEQYIAQAEQRLASALSKIKGAGNVSVIVSVDDDGEKVLATDDKNKSESQTDDKTTSQSYELEKTTVMAGQGSAQQPFVVREKKPEPVGVIVIADGAGDETVRRELYEAVRALYGIAPHRIKVVVRQI